MYIFVKWGYFFHCSFHLGAVGNCIRKLSWPWILEALNLGLALFLFFLSRLHKDPHKNVCFRAPQLSTKRRKRKKKRVYILKSIKEGKFVLGQAKGSGSSSVSSHLGFLWWSHHKIEPTVNSVINTIYVLLIIHRSHMLLIIFSISRWD